MLNFRDNVETAKAVNFKAATPIEDRDSLAIIKVLAIAPKTER